MRNTTYSHARCVHDHAGYRWIHCERSDRNVPKNLKQKDEICVHFLFVRSESHKKCPHQEQKKEELLRAYKEVYSYCQQRGFTPKLHKLDNETSKDVEDFIASQRAAIQYTPPDTHRANPAKRAIQTWKSCMKSTIASLPQKFPLGLWCRLCPQVDLSVNIVRKCRQNPALSAWAAMEGEYHFNATPIAPPGSEMMIHKKPGRRRTFGMNAQKAWYLGPCFKHYRAFRGIVPSTGGERISDTVKFRHHAIAIPSLTPADRILEAAQDLDDAIRQQPKQALLDERKAIELLREVLLGKRKTPLPPNSVQRRKQAKTAAPQPAAPKPKLQQVVTTTAAASAPAPVPSPTNNNEPVYISDDKDKDIGLNHQAR